jgi:NAD(P)H-dependent FMN reductase
MIDWVSRPRPNEPYLVCFINKVVTLMSASPGELGGLRGLVHVRAIFGNVFSIVLPKQKCIPKADQAFDTQGNLKDTKQQEEVKNLGRDLAQFLAKIK